MDINLDSEIIGTTLYVFFVCMFYAIFLCGFAYGVFLWIHLMLKRSFLKKAELPKEKISFPPLPINSRTFIGIALLSIVFPLLCQKCVLWTLNWKRIAQLSHHEKNSSEKQGEDYDKEQNLQTYEDLKHNVDPTPEEKKLTTAQSDETVRLIALGTSSQVGLVVLLWMVFRLHPSLFPSLTVTTLSIKTIFFQAFRVYALSLPLILVLAMIWQFMLKILTSFGLKIVIDNQAFVRLLLKGEVPTPWMLHMLFFACIVAPLTEEILFRGFLLRFLMDRMRLLTAVIVSGFVFAAMHNHLTSFFPLWGLGILLSTAYCNSGNLAVSIVFHGLFNATMFLFTLLAGIFKAS